MTSLAILPADLVDPCSGVSKNDARVHGPYSRLTAREHGAWTRVLCTEHPCARAVLAPSTVIQCFIADTAREHGCSVHTTRVHGPYSYGLPTRPVNAGRVFGCPKWYQRSRAVREHG